MAFHQLQASIVVHDSNRLDTAEGTIGQGLPSYDVVRFSEFIKHVSHNPNPLSPIYGSSCKHDPLRFRYPTALEVKRGRQIRYL